MKVMLFLILLLSAPSILAAQNFTIQNEDIQLGETILGTITLENATFEKEISPSDISFFQGRKQVFFEYDILFYEGTHYFYAYATQEGNFTIKISNILYNEDGSLKSLNLEKEISIKSTPLFDEETNETYTQILEVRPGFIFGTQDQKIKVTNKGSRQVNFTYEKEQISLEILETKELNLTKKDKINYFEISSYKNFVVPAIDPFYNGSLEVREDLDLRTPIKSLDLQLTRNKETKQTIEFYNFGDGNITEVKFSSAHPFVKFEGFQSIQARGIKNASVIFLPTSLGNFKGEIMVSYYEYNKTNNLTIPFQGIVLPEGINISDIVVEEQTCSQIKGSICQENEICSGESKFTKGVVYCCLAECIEIEGESKGSNYGTLIGLLILLGLAAIAGYFYKRSKKFGPKGAAEKINESSKKFEGRMNPEKSKRITGGLDRV